MHERRPPTPPLPSPLVIGGVGGSGTRVVAAAAQALGYAIGEDLNEPLDNLAFTLLFKDAGLPGAGDAAFDQRLRLFLRAAGRDVALRPGDVDAIESLCRRPRPGAGPVEHPVEWLQQRADRLRRAIAAPAQVDAPWGWKEPNAHWFVPQLATRLPGLRYIHVVRNGLDMAYSHNRNQLHFWGEAALGRTIVPGPVDALAYWCHVHRRIRDIGAGLGGRFLWLDYDALCEAPLDGMVRLLAFLGQPAQRAPALASLVDAPASRGRAGHFAPANFDPEDLEFLRELGQPGTDSL